MEKYLSESTWSGDIKISSAKSINFPWVFLEKISSMFNQQTNALL